MTQHLQVLALFRMIPVAQKKDEGDEREKRRTAQHMIAWYRATTQLHKLQKLQPTRTQSKQPSFSLHRLELLATTRYRHSVSPTWWRKQKHHTRSTRL